ncbi:protein of unknown function [Agreia sp. COWG]|nr:protein of unknown function [Agreia sp. COWG]
MSLCDRPRLTLDLRDKYFQDNIPHSVGSEFTGRPALHRSLPDRRPPSCCHHFAAS